MPGPLFIIIAQRFGVTLRVTSAESIEQAIAHVIAATSHGEGTGDVLVGAHARITRRPDALALGATGSLSAAWPVQLPDSANEMDPADLTTSIRQLASEITASLETVAPGWHVAIQPFDPALNGPISWWQSGQAAVTRTRDQYVPSFLDLFNPTVENESPAGPDRPVQTVSRSGGGVSQGLAALETVATTTLWIGLGGVALYGLYKVVRGTSFQEPSTPPPQPLPPGHAHLPAPAPRLTYAQRHARSLPGLSAGYRR